MKVAVVGSRSVTVRNLGDYLPAGVTEIISGGAAGVDTCAKLYAKAHHIRLTEILPDYPRFRRGAPLKRNLAIIEAADLVLAFWDGKSKGTKFVINNCKKRGVPVRVIPCGK